MIYLVQNQEQYLSGIYTNARKAIDSLLRQDPTGKLYDCSFRISKGEAAKLLIEEEQVRFELNLPNGELFRYYIIPIPSNEFEPREILEILMPGESGRPTINRNPLHSQH